MTFSYSFNAGKIQSGYDPTYLKTAFGFSDTPLTGAVLTGTTNGILTNIDTFATEYQAKFGKTLAISDNYKLFDDGTMKHLLDTNFTDVNYTSITAVSRVDAYKEMFLEKFKPTTASANLNIANSSSAYNMNAGNLGGYTWDNGACILNQSAYLNNKDDLTSLYNQLESEANTLAEGLHSSTLAYGGYPEIGYSSVDAEIKLLNQQLDSTMQDFVKLYDDLFAHFKIKDNQSDIANKEKRAATEATMTAVLAMQYAEKYYSQSIKPTAAEYVFGQAPLTFMTADKNEPPEQNAALVGLIDAYTNVSNANLQNILFNNQSGYKTFNKAISTTLADYMTTMPVGSTNADSQDIEFRVRDAFGVGGWTTTIAKTDECADSATFIAANIVEIAQKLVDLKMKIQIKTVESSINNQARAEYEARIGAMQAIQQTLENCGGTDPYTININGQKYMLGQDKNDDGTINNITEILGIRDTQDNLFESLKKLDNNNDGYVSQEEMQAHHIILNAVDNESGQLTNVGYDMSLVKGINLAELQTADGTNNIFGKFTMDLQDKKVNGDLTFEDKSYFDKLFASNVDFSTLDSIEDEKSSDAIAIPSSVKAVKFEEIKEPATEDSVSATTETAKPAEEKPAAKEFSLFDAKNFSFDFVRAEDNKSAFEKLLDQLSWQMNITNLTSTQRYNILDGIDASQDVALAKTEIQQELEKINLSA
ncbi:MAG: hypothetical protein WCF95_01485 [bacterium]